MRHLSQRFSTVIWKLLICGIFISTSFLPLNAKKKIMADPQLHRPFEIILQLYVNETRFDYSELYRNKNDLQRLYDYVDTLQTLDPSVYSERDALAYWINLYNSATLRLILQNYPVKSIKDLGSFLSSPWKKKILTVAGHGELSLDEVEHEIIRAKFKDARIHFALNCASIGCPPLASYVYQGHQLDQQLDTAVRFALSKSEWMDLSGKDIRVTKIFDWYQNDFEEYSGSVREFIVQYFPGLKNKILDDRRKLKYKKYNWKLNQVQ